MRISPELMVLAGASSYALFGTSLTPTSSTETGPSCILRHKSPCSSDSTSITNAQVVIGNDDLEMLMQRWREAGQAVDKIDMTSDYDDGICWNLTDPDSLGVPQPLSTHTIMAQFEEVTQGKPIPLDFDNVDLMILDI